MLRGTPRPWASPRAVSPSRFIRACCCIGLLEAWLCHHGGRAGGGGGWWRWWCLYPIAPSSIHPVGAPRALPTTPVSNPLPPACSPSTTPTSLLHMNPGGTSRHSTQEQSRPGSRFGQSWREEIISYLLSGCAFTADVPRGVCIIVLAVFSPCVFKTEASTKTALGYLLRISAYIKVFHHGAIVQS